MSQPEPPKDFPDWWNNEDVEEDEVYSFRKSS